MNSNSLRMYSEPWADYELMDAGNGEKLERWGNIITIRPDVNAYFKPVLSRTDWQNQAHFRFVETQKNSGEWQTLRPNTSTTWQIHYQHLQLELELTRFKHVGLFPEQRANWDFIQQHLAPAERFLNLFAYTGAASCIARHIGAETTHVDSVKQLITWAHRNMEINQLQDIKWMHDDALKFAAREVKRARQYDGIIMDPPAWGLGAKGEKWKLEQKLDSLLEHASQLLNSNGFLILNTYSPAVTCDDLTQYATRYFRTRHTEVRELWMESTTGKALYYGNVLRVR